MARKYAPVLCSIWEDEDFIALTASAQRAYLLLLSQKRLNMLGVLPFTPIAWARKCADENLDDLSRSISELEAANFVVIDHETQELLIRTMVKHDPPRGPKSRVAMWRAFDVIDSKPLKIAVCAEIEESIWADEQVPPPGEALALRNAPSHPPSHPPSDGARVRAHAASSLIPPSTDPPSTDPIDSACLVAPVDNPQGSSLSPAEPATTHDPMDLHLTELLIDRFAAHAGTPAQKITGRMGDDMRLLRQRGPTTWAKPAALKPEVVAEMIETVFDGLATRSNSGFCWADQVRSPGALRRHWDKLAQAASTRSPNTERLARGMAITRRLGLATYDDDPVEVQP